MQTLTCVSKTKKLFTWIKKGEKMQPKEKNAAHLREKKHMYVNACIAKGQKTDFKTMS